MEYSNKDAMTRADALNELLGLWRPEPRVEQVSLDRAFGRVLAAGLQGQCNLPVVRASRFDGICVRSADFEAGLPDTSGWVLGRDYDRADTGDDFPDAFDAVIAVESTRTDAEGRLSIVPDGKFEMFPGAGVSPCGAISRKGEAIAGPGTRLTPELVAAAAVGGYAQVPVYARPRVAFIPTGTELRPWGSFPQRGQNLEANSLLIQGLLQEWGAEPLVYPLVPDDRPSLEAALDRALEAADVVVLNAGSSLGGDDHNANILQERGTYFRHGVKTVPGRPVGRALVQGKPVVNAPGPVLAAWLCMEWLVRGLVAHWYGMPAAVRERMRVRLAAEVRDPKARERIVRVTLAPGDDGVPVATPVPGKLGVPQTLVGTDALFILGIDQEGVAAGELVEVELLRPRELMDLG